MSSSTSEEWLNLCRTENMPIPPFDRYIYMLSEHVVKKRLTLGELGYDGYEPNFSTTPLRDKNELRTMELVRNYTNIPVPKLIFQGDG
ncbi:Choline/ethanolamine kinase, partial [Aspergillus sclerotialis]